MVASSPHLAVCPVLIGHAEQLAVLRERIEAIRVGQGQCVLIAGEAGLGKSRLAAEAKRYAAERGFELLEGACFPQDSACPYAPLIDLLRGRLAAGALPDALIGRFAHELAPLLPDLLGAPPGPPDAVAPDPAQQQRRLFNALLACLAPADHAQPALVLIEDLHWCDESSLDLLLYLLRRSAGRPLLLLGTYRSDEVGPRLGRWLAHLEREHHVQELYLPPLTRDEVATMLRAIFALPRPVRVETLDTIYTLTEGNPFFVEELLKALIAAGDIFYAEGIWDRKPLVTWRVPRSLNDAVEQRVARLSDAARELLVLAAVVGRRFDFALLQRLTRRDEGALLQLIKELIAAQLVVEESAERFAFRHALTRQAIYGGLLARERAALHRSIAQAIEQSHADALEPHVADLAYHFAAAGSWAQALEYGQWAGERAQALGSPLTAVEQYSRALDAAGAMALAPPATLFMGRGHAYETLGDFERARSDYEQALDLARAAGDGAATWQSMLNLGQLWAGRDYQQTGDWFRQALDLAHELGEPRRLARSFNRLGNWQINRGDSEAGMRLHEQALALFEAEDDRQGMADTLDLLGMANGLYGDMHRSVEQFSRAIELYRALGDSAGLSSALASRATFAGGINSGPAVNAHRGFEACRADLSEALHLARQMDWLAGQAYAEYSATMVHEIFGEYGAALAHGRAALEIATSIDHRQWMTATHEALGNSFLMLLAIDRAVQHLRASQELAQALGSEVFARKSTSRLAEAYLLAGDLSRAEVALAPMRSRGPALRNFEERRTLLVWGRLALARGDAAQALEIAERLIATAPGAVREPIPVVLKLKGEALLALGQLEAAAQALEAARDAAEAQGLRPLLWPILRSLGQAQQRLGCRKEARQSFAAARELVGALAATLDDAELREQFTRAALESLPQEPQPTAQRAETARFGGLTERERAVMALAAQGKSNQEIAASLVVSKRTVETHIGNAMAKLGVSSRAELIAWAFRQGLAQP